MAHARTQIRQVFKDWITAIPDFGGRIDIDRSINSQFNELPHVIIYNKPERSVIAGISGQRLMREFELAVLIKAEAEGDSVMDEYASKVEAVIDQRRQPGTLWHEITLVSSVPDFDDLGAVSVATLELTYLIKYMTDSANPSQTY